MLWKTENKEVEGEVLVVVGGDVIGCAIGPLKAHHKQRKKKKKHKKKHKSSDVVSNSYLPNHLYTKSHIPKEVLGGKRINTSSTELCSIFSDFLHLC